MPMINRRDHPVGWALLLYELSDAHEHLGKLLQTMEADSEYSEPELRGELGHVLAHLHRAWHRRDFAEDITEAQWQQFRGAPNDLEPLA